MIPVLLVRNLYPVYFLDAALMVYGLLCIVIPRRVVAFGQRISGVTQPWPRSMLLWRVLGAVQVVFALWLAYSHYVGHE